MTTDHIQLDTKALVCRRCGDTYRPTLDELDTFDAKAHVAWVRAHQRCAP